MKKVSKFFGCFVLVIAFSQTVFGQVVYNPPNAGVHNLLDAWVYNKFEKLDSGIASSVHAIYPGKVNNQGIDRVGIGTTIPGAALHVRGEDNNGSKATLKISSENQTMLLDGNEIDTAVGPLLLNCNSNRKVIIAAVGIGTASPGARLDVNGQVQIRGGTPATGKVLTASNANGLATWQTPPAGADNLGNHIATQNVQLNGNWLSGDGGSEGVSVAGNGKVSIGNGGTPISKMQFGSVGNGTPFSAGPSGTVNFLSSFSGTPMVFLNVLRKPALNSISSTYAFLESVSSSGFDWGSNGSNGVDQLFWMAIGP